MKIAPMNSKNSASEYYWRMIKIGPDKMDPFPHSVGSCPVCGGCSFTRDCFLCRSVGKVEILYDLRLQTVPYLMVLPVVF